MGHSVATILKSNQNCIALYPFSNFCPKLKTGLNEVRFPTLFLACFNSPNPIVFYPIYKVFLLEESQLWANIGPLELTLISIKNELRLVDHTSIVKMQLHVDAAPFCILLNGDLACTKH